MSQAVNLPMKPADLLPKELLGDALPLHAYLDAFGKFLVLSIPCILIAASALIAVIELSKRGASEWVIVTLIVLACLMVGVIVYAYAAYQLQVEDYQNRQNTRHQAMLIISVGIQNLTINNVDVRGKHNAVNMNQAQIATQTVPDADATQMHMVARHIALKAIDSWVKNGGKAVKPKPISAQVIGEELGVGGETWQTAVNLCDEAGVTMNAALPTKWRVLISSPKQAEDALHQAMLRRGYASRHQNGEQTWYKIVPALQG